jgi:hypothetical protein
MNNQRIWGLLAVALLAVGFFGSATTVQAQYYQPYYQGYQLNRLFHYPYYYYPFNYWPAMGPRWPEPPGAPYMRPPAYMAYPAFREAGWRYEMWQPQRYYRGSHFWLDQF